MPRFNNRNTGGSLDFNGSSTTLTGAVPFITASSTSLTVVLSVYIPRSTFGQDDFIIGNGSNNTVNGFGMRKYNDGTMYLYHNGSFMNFVPKYNQWNTYVIHIEKGVQYKILENGVLKGTQGATSSSMASSSLTVGHTASTQLLEGKVSSIRIWVDKTYSTAELQNLYYSGVTAGSSLIWNLDEMTGSTALDTSGNANNGTIVSGTWSTERPFAGRNVVENDTASLSFNGTSDNVTATSTSNPFSTAGTISVKFKLRSLTANQSIFGNSLNNTGMQITYRSSGLVLEGGNGSSTISTTGYKLITGQWYRATGVFNGSTLSLYINDQLVSVSSAITVIADSVRALTIAKGAGGAFDYCNCLISNAVAFSRAFTNSEVITISNTNTYIRASISSEFIINEGAGTTAYDSSGNGNNGTITGAIWSSDTPTKARKIVGGNMIANGDMSYIPSSNVALTTTKKWLDGTAGGSSTFDGFRWGATIIGTSSTLFDTTNKYNNNSSIKGSLVGVNSYIEISITPDNSISTNIKKYAIPVLPNTSYTTIYAMKTNYISGDSNNGAVVYNTCWDGTGAFTSNRNTPTAIKTTTGWTIYTNQFTTGANDRFVTITPSLEGRTGTATLIMDAWFANITLVPTSQLTASATSRLPSSRLVVGGNMVYNGDFSYIPSTNTPQTTASAWLNGSVGGSSTQKEFGWAIPTSGVTASASAVFDSATIYNGKPTLKLSTLDASGIIVVAQSDSASNPSRFSNNIVLKPSTSYTLTGYIKTSNVATNSAYFDFREFSGNGTAVATTSSTKLSGTNDFTLVTLTITTQATTRFGMILCRNFVAGNIGSAWFANITLTPTVNTVRTQVS